MTMDERKKNRQRRSVESNANKNKNDEDEISIQSSLAQLNDSTKFSLGHQLEDMLVGCQLNRKKCSTKSVGGSPAMHFMFVCVSH